MMKLRMALTKGRLERKTVELFGKAGLDCASLLRPGRKLIHSVGELDVVLAKAPDVITYVEHGVCDVGVVGRDTILENGRSFYEVLDLGFGACRFSLAARQGDDFFASYQNKRVATKYPHVAKQFFAGKGMDVEIIKIEGSVELAPLLGLTDAIVDIVETGETLRANGLTPIEDIHEVSARLIVNIGAMKTKRREVDDLIALFKGVGEC